MTYIAKIIFILFLGVLTVVGCASLSEKECIEGDWYTIGVKDGTAGEYAGTKFENHTKACGKHGIAPDSAAYELGHSAGLREFCTAPGAIKLANKNSSKHSTAFYKVEHEYTGICPADLEPQFLEIYIRELQIRLSQLKRKYARSERALETSERELALLEALEAPTKDQIEEAEQNVSKNTRTIQSIEKDLDSTQAFIIQWKQKL